MIASWLNLQDCLRRFWDRLGPIQNPEYDADLSHVHVSDFGNIAYENIPTTDVEKILEKLQQKVSLFRSKGSIPFVVGGTKELSFATIRGTQVTPGRKLGVINLSDTIDAQPCYDYNKIDQCSWLRVLLEKKTEMNGNIELVCLGSVGDRITKEGKEFIETNTDKHNIIFNKDLSKHTSEALSRGASLFKEALNFLSACDEVHLILSLEVINSSFCPGVSNPLTVGGFTVEDITDIFLEAGRSSKIVSVDISGFNPAVEDFRTGRLISALIYYFVLGYSSRVKQ
eukprot:TRINITY_DN3266_c0_g1_i15.p1 TRINITY_DN3266_c0_g1~~TRINITY_DN3266_c0_g1_i15.p1  ORF type:complete len:284 (-),score=43.58 TRINITY_DN3266_c0_g1_i15:84-935(-)